MADHAPLAPKPGAQAYGATATRRTRPRTRYEACASSITLRQGYAQAPGGQASMLSSVANLCNTIIGAGICAMPYAFAAAGIVPGVLLVLLCGLTSYFGLYLLTRCAARLGGTRTSFFAVASAAMPRGSWDVRRLIDGAIAVKCFGVSISYLIISGQLMPQVVLGLTRVWHADPEKLPSALYTREFWILVWVLLLAPLTLLRRLDSLRHTSYLSFLSVCYLVVIVVYYFFVPPQFSPTGSGALLANAASRSRVQVLSTPPKQEEWHWFNMDRHFLSVFPVYVFAFTCAQNVFSVYNELREPTEARLDVVLSSSIGLAGTLYQVVAILGYITFGSSVSNNVIASYPSNSLFVCGGRLAIVGLTLMGYPLQVHPCRASLDKIFSQHEQQTDLQISPTATAAETEGEESSYFPRTESGAGMPSTATASTITIPTVPPHMEMGALKWGALTLAIVGGGAVIALLVEDLSTILSFVGAVGSTTVSFILPGLLYWMMFRHADPADETPDGTVKLFEEQEDEDVDENVRPDEESKVLQDRRAKRRRTLAAALSLSVWGVLVLCISLTANIIKAVS